MEVIRLTQVDCLIYYNYRLSSHSVLGIVAYHVRVARVDSKVA